MESTESELKQSLQSLRTKIQNLEGSKACLIDEKASLKEKVKSIRDKESLRATYWGQMTKKQLFCIFVAGAILTGLLIVPFYNHALFTVKASSQTLRDETELVSYLQQAQGHDKVYVGVHGYNHECPICGGNDHELVCPNGEMPSELIQHRIEKGLEIFNLSGLKADWYAFPGMVYSEEALGFLKSLGFYTVEYEVVGWKTLDGIVGSSMIGLSSGLRIKEYTWMWRDSFSKKHLRSAYKELSKDAPVQILMHIQDFTNQTRDFLENAILSCDVSLIRCDDIAHNGDLARTKQLVKLAAHHNVNLLLAVIPASVGQTQTAYLDVPFKLTWVLFVVSFMFPFIVMMPWALFFRWNRKNHGCTGSGEESLYPPVSMILPAYNEEKIIGKSIEECLNQDYRGRTEIIVVDDGSTDRTYDIAERYADQNSKIRVIRHEQNKGKSFALNTGFAQARGEISVFSDTDSVLTPDALSKLVPHFKDPEVGMVAGMVVVRNENGLLTRLQQIDYLFTQLIIRFCQSSQKNVLICPGAATAVRTQIAREIPVEDRTVTEDADFTFSVWKRGWKVAQEPEAISFTEAPENLKAFWNQRKRWFYGSLQTLAIHKWTVKKGNPWVINAWIQSLLSPFTILTTASIPLICLFSQHQFSYSFFGCILLLLAAFSITRITGIKLYNGGGKLKLALLIPVYVVYEFFLNLLMAYCVLAFLTRRGMHIRHGGRVIHAT